MPRFFCFKGSAPCPCGCRTPCRGGFIKPTCKGPTALLRLFEEAFGRHALYSPPEPDQQQRTIHSLSEQIGRLKAQNERLQAEVSDLRGHNFQLQRRNAELEALAARDSHNSSRPPSTDPAWAKRTRSLRQPSGKRPGGQVGHRGETLGLSARPDRVVESRSCCWRLRLRLNKRARPARSS
jgi:hypothetical protein